MGYFWNDCYGERLKELVKVVYDALKANAKDSIPDAASDALRRTMRPSYAKPIEWEILVFRKKARPRGKTPNKSFQRGTR
jgi:hypothetical protein